MLRHIAIVTIVVNQLSAVEEPYRQQLDYAAVQRGVVSAEQAALWSAPAMARQPMSIVIAVIGIFFRRPPILGISFVCTA